ncbi:UbiH/UbiF/VisC/COQ6 family ubiquinone biosynthesis hydroxylase [Pseudidiomarina sp.]|uniref:UbiH/UbiF/VisC/COQ6 family ubiquinone biosynthesis hydroxylase n=1 Tax=Pseudidiomarina sp. TaxID=2081707 RepID=UPI00299CEB8C|nr:UbiH/UbiF/VisC/COQ6 family ubiquinone biosynthesis hydroxylase [Pseudidiomarina sp.]MDX1705644.1 UbiH/UbiF/VisC/COQ6 family ubiquinone biosynthesis hydroxylase [Pseudidiomarina sp.]
MSKAGQNFIITGAGMMGLSMALGLRQQGHQVDLIEQGERPDYSDAPELRVSALAHRSRDLLQQLGVWKTLPGARLGPYTGMEVWDRDSFGRIQFDAAEVHQDNLGAIVENAVLEQTLWDAAEAAGVRLSPGTTVSAQQLDDNGVRVSLSDGRQLQADYLIAADGARSQTRERAQLPLTFWDYEQQGIVAVINTVQPHGGVARQVFMPEGPLAFLPLADPQQVSIVWSADNERAEQLKAMSEDDFCKQLQAASDHCLGKLQLASPRASFPLRMHYAQRWLQQRLIVIGDAAHSIHPLAGQGANLGFADVAALLRVFSDTIGDDRQRALRSWERERKAAAVVMIAAMESFKRGFGTSQPLIKMARGLGLQLAHRLSSLKQRLIHAALGQ